MNVFAKFDEMPSMILEVIKETKRFGHTVGRSVGQLSIQKPLRITKVDNSNSIGP